MAATGISIPKTFGALLIGGLFASLLSGFVIIQVVLYFKLYQSDRARIKALVLIIWFLDTCHTVCIWLSLWSYLIDNYGNLPGINIIHCLALSVQFPAILTFFVHIFFAQRIFMLSKRNYLLTVPIFVLAVLRVVSGSVTTAFMLHLHTFTRFRQDVRFIFTTGLALSTAVDVLITASLFILLRTNRTGVPHRLDVVIDALIRYTFETSSLTCAGTIASMLCWTIIPHNLIFMGLHFVIGKLYANSLLVTLNTRETIRRARSQGSGDHGLRVNILQDSRRHKTHDSDRSVASPVSPLTPSPTDSKFKEERVEIVVEQCVQSVNY